MTKREKQAVERVRRARVKAPESAILSFVRSSGPEVILGLSKALSTGIESADLETRINKRIQALAAALSKLTLPRKSLPIWIRKDLSETELFWFATAISAFYDERI
jgi:hypothetical protein